jgi:predicted alpha/beta-hydrolase family hydrolase
LERPAGGGRHGGRRASSVVLLLGASLSFLVVLGTRLVIGDIVAPAWNA